jgi:hypothetical protein
LTQKDTEINESKRYYPCDVRLKSGDAQVMFTEHLAGQLCIYEAIAPIVQRNRELEAELARLREQEPAQEIPTKLVEWANSWKEDDSDMTSYLIGCNDMKHFVNSQLGK